jgi:hypothetical protein
VLIFIGGMFRYEHEGSVLGVHRFQSLIPSQDPGADAQVVSAEIANYIAEMSVDTGLLRLMSSAAASTIRILSPEELRQLRVVNNGADPPAWTMQSRNDLGIYLRGQQVSADGTHKLIFLCTQHSVLFVGMYEAGSRSTEVVAWAGARQAIILDGEQTFITSYRIGLPAADHGYVVATYRLPAQLMQLVLTAQTVGFAFRPPNDDWYWGFEFAFGEGRDHLRNLLEICR